MNKGSVCVAAVIGAGLLAVAPVAPADSADALLARVGRFQLDNGESRTVLRGPAVKGYRVCMEEGRGAVPLKVTYEGGEAIVAPGECRLIEAPKIKLASATRVPDGLTLIGSFGGQGAKRYETDVSLAQTARNE